MYLFTLKCNLRDSGALVQLVSSLCSSAWNRVWYINVHNQCLLNKQILLVLCPFHRGSRSVPSIQASPSTEQLWSDPPHHHHPQPSALAPAAALGGGSPHPGRLPCMVSPQRLPGPAGRQPRRQHPLGLQTARGEGFRFRFRAGHFRFRPLVAWGADRRMAGLVAQCSARLQQQVGPHGGQWNGLEGRDQAPGPARAASGRRQGGGGRPFLSDADRGVLRPRPRCLRGERPPRSPFPGVGEEEPLGPGPMWHWGSTEHRVPPSQPPTPDRHLRWAGALRVQYSLATVLLPRAHARAGGMRRDRQRGKGDESRSPGPWCAAQPPFSSWCWARVILKSPWSGSLSNRIWPSAFAVTT